MPLARNAKRFRPTTPPIQQMSSTWYSDRTFWYSFAIAGRCWHVDLINNLLNYPFCGGTQSKSWNILTKLEILCQQYKGMHGWPLIFFCSGCLLNCFPGMCNDMWLDPLPGRNKWGCSAECLWATGLEQRASFRYWYAYFSSKEVTKSY